MGSVGLPPSDRLYYEVLGGGPLDYRVIRVFSVMTSCRFSVVLTFCLSLRDRSRFDEKPGSLNPTWTCSRGLNE